MIHEEICTYEVAMLAKEKGFDWPTPKNYRHENGATCNAPTQSLLQRWLREEKKIEVYVRNFEKTTDFPHHYWNFITDGNGKTLKVGNKMFDTYELALEDALAYSLKNLV